MKTHILCSIVFCSIITLSWGEGGKDVSDNQDTKSESFKNAIKIIRQTKAERDSTPLVIAKKMTMIKFAILNKKQLHSPLTSLIPVHKAHTIYVFFTLHPKSILDDELIEILQKSVVVNREEIVSNSTVNYCNIRFEDKSVISIQTMVGGKEGCMTLTDGTRYWFKIPKEPIKISNKSQQSNR